MYHVFHELGPHTLNPSHQLNSSQIVAEAYHQLSASGGVANRVARNGIDSLILAKLQNHLASLQLVPPLD